MILKHIMSNHLIACHFSFHFHFMSCISFHFHFISFNFIFHFISSHLISFHCHFIFILFHFISFHFISFPTMSCHISNHTANRMRSHHILNLVIYGFFVSIQINASHIISYQIAYQIISCHSTYHVTYHFCHFTYLILNRTFFLNNTQPNHFTSFQIK